MSLAQVFSQLLRTVHFATVFFAHNLQLLHRFPISLLEQPYSPYKEVLYRMRATTNIKKTKRSWSYQLSPANIFQIKQSSLEKSVLTTIISCFHTLVFESLQCQTGALYLLTTVNANNLAPHLAQSIGWWDDTVNNKRSCKWGQTEKDEQSFSTQTVDGTAIRSGILGCCYRGFRSKR